MKGFIAAFVMWALLAVGCISGWVMNVIALWNLAVAGGPITMEAGMRAAGVFIAPLGAILGWLW